MIKRFVPTREELQRNRFLRWLGPRIHDPLLWHINRNSVARGVAIGMFFGLTVPVAQIAAAAMVSLAVRANLWVAALATLISNPVTYGPIYIFAYRIGSSLLPTRSEPAETAVEEQATAALQWLLDGLSWMTGIGAPLVLGTLIMATVASTLGYFIIMLVWRINVVIKHRQRRQRMAVKRSMHQ